MALSGSTNYSLNRDEVIQAAFDIIGMTAIEESLTASEISTAAKHLNMMIKAWQPKGIKIWQNRSTSLTLVASQQSYTLGPTGDEVIGRPLDILRIVRRDSSNNDVPLSKLTQQEWWELTPKTSTGTPVQYYYDEQLTNGVLYVWQVPDATAAAAYTLEILYRKPIDDLDASTNDFEFPQEWLEAITWGLAARLCPIFGIDVREARDIRAMAMASLQEAESWSGEEGSVYITPADYRGFN